VSEKGKGDGKDRVQEKTSMGVMARQNEGQKRRCTKTSGESPLVMVKRIYAHLAGGG